MTYSLAGTAFWQQLVDQKFDGISSNAPYWFMKYDPFIYVSLMYQTDPVLYEVHGTSSISNWRTRVQDPASAMWFNLRLFQDVLYGNPTHKVTGGNWKPRSRISLSGAELTGYSLGIYSLKDIADGAYSWYTAVENPYYYDVPVTLFKGPSYYCNLTFDQLRDYAISLQEIAADPTALHTVARLNSNTNYRKDCYITNLNVGSDSITYHGYCKYARPVAPKWLSVDYDAVIYRHDQSSDYQFTFYCNWYTYGDLTTHKSVSDPSYNRRSLSPVAVIGDPTDLIGWMEEKTSHSIIGAHPALYLTQSKALSALIGEISANFETLVESLDWFLLADLVLNTPVKDVVEKFVPYGTLLTKVTMLLRLIGSGYIFKIFALDPTLSSLQDALGRASELSLFKYESTISITNESLDFTSLDEGLQAYIIGNWGFDPSDVVEYKVVFHTEVIPDVDTDFMIKVVQGSLSDFLAKTGSYPSVGQLWNGIPFSFVAENYLPIGKFTRAFENYARFDRAYVSSMGHSAYIRCSLADGRQFDVYLRSDAKVEPIDPPTTIWVHETPNPVLVPVAIIVALGLSS